MQFDWDTLRTQLTQQDEAQALQNLLQRRARQYATAHDQQESVSMQTMLAFDLGEERYGVDVMLVQTVRPVDKITAVPGVPRFYKGVVNIRGQIITVMDLRLFFNMEAPDVPQELIIVEAHQIKIGLLVHRVHDILNIPETEIEPLDDMRYALGLTRDRLTLLDIRKLLEDERLIIGDE